MPHLPQYSIIPVDICTMIFTCSIALGVSTWTHLGITRSSIVRLACWDSSTTFMLCHPQGTCCTSANILTWYTQHFYVDYGKVLRHMHTKAIFIMAQTYMYTFLTEQFWFLAHQCISKSGPFYLWAAIHLSCPRGPWPICKPIWHEPLPHPLVCLSPRASSQQHDRSWLDGSYGENIYNTCAHVVCNLYMRYLCGECGMFAHI